MEDIILRGNVLFSGKRDEIEVHPHSFVICRGGCSCGVYEEIPSEYKDIPVQDFGDDLIIPGLVDLHIHAPQYAFRGTGMDMELLGWLREVAFPEECRYSDTEYAARAYSIFSHRMKKSATTRAVIFGTRHREATGILMDLMEETGLITYVGKVNMDRGRSDELNEESAEVSMDETRKWLHDISDRYERTKPILTPRFVPSCSDELLQGLGELRKAKRLPLQSHLSENPEEVQMVMDRFPDVASYGHVYDRYGQMGDIEGDEAQTHTVMAHCIYSTDDEMSLLKRSGTFIAHCPASNTNLASGIAPIRKYLKNDMRVGLASDVAGGQTESMFHALTSTVQVSKLYWRLIDKDCKPLSFDEAFYLATRGGGEFFGKVGSFEKGYEFDALVLDDTYLLRPGEISLKRRLERFAYLAGDINGIKAKFCRGRRII